ncbi:MAG: FtsH protease activity modulator HflK [Deltaproteobacteria bacterium]|nr:FtsH protease activity modulator HflK [Deltaproteobacteria bacterium]
MASSPPTNDPISVRVIRRTADRVRERPARLLVPVAGLFFVLSLVGSVYTVGNGESAAVRRFGKVVNASVESGLRVRWPWGVDQVEKAMTGQVYRMELLSDPNLTGRTSSALPFFTGDENIVEVTTVLQYTITDLGQYLYGSPDPRELIRLTVRAALADSIAGMRVDDVLTTGKAAIQQQARARAQADLNKYGAGVSLSSLNIQSIKPPPEAETAFRRVNDAKAEAARTRNEAETNRDRVISLAKGSASRLASEAESAAAARVNQAEGAAQRFDKLLVEKRRNATQTRTDLYLDTVAGPVKKARMIVLPPGQAPNVDLHLVDPNVKTPSSAGGGQLIEPTDNNTLPPASRRGPPRR